MIMLINEKSNSCFSPFYFPEILFYREKDRRRVQSSIKDSIYDNKPLNIIYRDVHGSGKFTCVSCIIRDFIKKSNHIIPFLPIIINCESSVKNVIMKILYDFSIAHNYSNNYLIQYAKTLVINELWDLFKYELGRIDDYILLILIDAHRMNNNYLKKIYELRYNFNLNIITTYDSRFNLHNLFSEDLFDDVYTLDPLTFDQIKAIYKDRGKEIFGRQLESRFIDYITEYTFTKSQPVPGVGIHFLEGLYGYLRINASDFNEFDEKVESFLEIFKSYPDISENILKSSIFHKLKKNKQLTYFIDYLKSYFFKKNNLYISSSKLLNYFRILSENFQENVNFPQCLNHIDDLVKYKLLLPSKNPAILKRNTLNNYYYINYSKFMLDTLLNPNYQKINY